MNEHIRNKINEAISSFEDSQQDPRVLVLGATGVGKSTIINALLGQKVHEVKTVESTTRSFATNRYQLADGNPIFITDSPGYGEVGHDREYSADVVAESARAHIILMVLKADEKGYQRDVDILAQVVRDPEFAIDKPVLIALNQVDKIKPLREWEPPYDFSAEKTPDDSEKLCNMRDKLALVKQQFGNLVDSEKLVVVPTMADSEEGDLEGIDWLKLRMFELLPEVARFRFARMSRFADAASQEVLSQIEKEADKVIAMTAAAAAGAVLVNPVPGSDIVVLLPLQITMIVKIGSLYGVTVDRSTAPEIIAAIGAGFGARVIFQEIISFIPGWKNILGPPYAAAATYGLGAATKTYFSRGTSITPEALKKVIEGELKRRQLQKPV